MLHRHYLEPKVGDDPTTYCLLSNCSSNVSYSGTAEMKALSSLDFPTELRRLHRTGISCLCFEPLASALELSYSLAPWMVPMSGFEPLTSSPWTMHLCHLGYTSWLLLLGSNQLSLGQSQVHCQLCEGAIVWYQWVDLNHRPLPCQRSALTNWATLIGRINGIRTHTN